MKKIILSLTMLGHALTSLFDDSVIMIRICASCRRAKDMALYAIIVPI